MAQPGAQVSSPAGSDLQKSQAFNRTFDLNITLGAECMRGLIKRYLKEKGVSLKSHLGERDVKKALNCMSLFPDQKTILRSPSPDLREMDVCLLALLLLNTFPDEISPDMKTNVTKLRDKRKTLAHPPQAEFDNNLLFNETSQYILAIAKAVDSDFHKHMVNMVNELRQREQVRHCRTIDLIRVNGEEFIVMLVKQKSGDGIYLLLSFV